MVTPPQLYAYRMDVFSVHAVFLQMVTQCGSAFENSILTNVFVKKNDGNEAGAHKKRGLKFIFGGSFLSSSLDHLSIQHLKKKIMSHHLLPHCSTIPFDYPYSLFPIGGRPPSFRFGCIGSYPCRSSTLGWWWSEADQTQPFGSFSHLW